MTPPWPSHLRLDRRRAWLAVACIALLGSSVLTLRTAVGAGTVWPDPSMALLLLAAPSALPRWRARALDAAVVSALTVVTLLALGVPAPSALAAAVLVVTSALVGLCVAERLRAGGLALERPADAVVLAATALTTGVAVCACGALLALLAGSPLGLLELAVQASRSTTSVLGLLTVATALFPTGGSARGAGWGTAPRYEQVAVWVAGAAAFGGVFGTALHLQVASVGIPVAVWAALRLSTRRAVLFLPFAAFCVVTGTAAGAGPFGPQSVGSRSTLDVLHTTLVTDSYIVVLNVVVLLVALTRDAVLVERARTAAALEQTREQRAVLQGVLDGATQQAIIATDAASRITLFSSGAERMTGYRAAEVLGQTPLRFYDPLELAERAAALGLPVEGGGAALTMHAADASGHATARWTVVRRDGSRLRALLSLSPRFDADGGRDGYVGVLTDVTAQAEERLALSEDQFRTAYETAPTGLVVISLSRGTEGRIRRVNAAFAAFTGRTEDELLRLRLADLLHEGDVEAHLAHLERAASGGEPEPNGVERRFTTPDGEVRWGRKSTSVITPTDGRDPYLLAVIEDVTARRAAEDALVRLAMHDALTGLPNRALLADRLERALTADERLGHGVTVIYGDLDGFKPVNDSHGHAAGDLLLKEVAARLEKTVRTNDTVARLGGDEFAILCPGLRTEQVPIVVDRIQRALSLPVRLPGGAVVRVGLSTGVASAVGGDDPARLLDEADQAMFVAKRRRKLEAGEAATRPAQPPLPAPRATSAYQPVADSHR